MMPRHGFRFIIQWASESQGRWTTVLLSALGLIALALLVVPWNAIFPPAANPAPAPVAHIQPAPSASPSASSVIQVNSGASGICIVPTSRAKRPLTLVKVP
jgi:hypothetical protein